jgi:hypothetical protein
MSETVRPLFAHEQPVQEVATEASLNRGYIQALNAALDIASARILGLIAVIGAVLMFGFAVWEPLPWRTYSVVAYAIVVLWPITGLYLKKG